MIAAVMKSASPTMIWFGGNSWVPIARRRNDSTMSTRGKQVVRRTTEGTRLKTVIRAISLSGVEICEGSSPARVRRRFGTSCAIASEELLKNDTAPTAATTDRLVLLMF